MAMALYTCMTLFRTFRTDPSVIFQCDVSWKVRAHDLEFSFLFLHVIAVSKDFTFVGRIINGAEKTATRVQIYNVRVYQARKFEKNVRRRGVLFEKL